MNVVFCRQTFRRMRQRQWPGLRRMPAAMAGTSGIESNAIKVKVRVTLDEVSLRLICTSKNLDKKLLDACVVPFLSAYNKRVETHKQCELEELISVNINGDMIFCARRSKLTSFQAGW